jgi:serine protease
MQTRLAFPLFAVVVAVSASSRPAQGSDVMMKAVRGTARAVPTGAFREGELIVAFRSTAQPRDMERALSEGGALAARRSRAAARFLVSLGPGSNAAAAAQRFSRMPEVAYAEPNGLVRKSQAQTFSPNDRFYKFQWNLKQMNAERTWGIQKGKTTVAVAVLDTGVAYEDYADPRTGKVYYKAPDWGDTTFLPGHDFVNDDDHPNDDEGHGTHVASTIAEATNNGLGLAGLAFDCAILPVKVLNEEGNGDDFGVAEGIDFATSFTQGGSHPVKVINLSLGGGFSETIKEAVDRAVAAGVLVVAAAGNSGDAGANKIDFPASLANVIAVGGLDERKERAPYSSTGPELDLMAPGGNCDRDDDLDGEPDCVFQQTLDPDGIVQGRYDEFCYCGLQGTSMATSHVSASAALLFSQGFVDAASVRAALEQTAERLGGAPSSGRNDTFGMGLVRPANALPGLGLNDGPPK